MEEIGEGLALIAILGFVAFWIWHGDNQKQDKRAERLREREKLLDRIGSGEALTHFLNTDEGKKLMNHMNAPEPRTSRGGGLKMSILGLMTAGVICVTLGAGFFFVAPRTQEELIIPGAIIGSVGIGCFAAALLHYLFGRAWNMLDANGQAQTAPRKKTLE
jgi:hypothetical protein